MIPRLQPRRPDTPSEGLENMLSSRTNVNAAASPSVLPDNRSGYGHLANHSADRQFKTTSNVKSTTRTTERSPNRSSLSIGSSQPLGMRAGPSRGNSQLGHEQSRTSLTDQPTSNLEPLSPPETQDTMEGHDRHVHTEQHQQQQSSSKHPELPEDLQPAMDEMQSPAHSFSFISTRSFSSLSCSSADLTPSSKMYYTSPLEEALSIYGNNGAGDDTGSAPSSAASASSSSSQSNSSSSSYHGQTLQQLYDLQSGNGNGCGSGGGDSESDDVASLTLTPPLAPWNHPPLFVSAKRHGTDVRRQHSKRRRRRRRRPKHPSESNSDNESKARNTAGGDSVSQIMGVADGSIMDVDGTEAKRLWCDEDIIDENGAIGGILARTAAAAATGAEASLMPDSSDEDDNDENDESDNLHLLFDPKEVSPEQAKIRYWEWCYGKGSSADMYHGAEGLVSSSFSASRAPPQKGCLSVAKPKRTFWAKRNPKNGGHRTQPTSPEELVLVQASSSVFVGKSVTTNDDADDGDNSTKTVKMNNTTKKAITSKAKKQRHVQFGSLTAVEYVIGEPAKQLTPLPNEVAKKRYSMDEKKSTVEEEELTIETKQNTSILAEWEDDFEVKGRFSGPSRRRGGSAGANGSRNRRRSKVGRRSSSIFSLSPMCLLEADTSKPCSSRDGCIQEEERGEDPVALPVTPTMEPEMSPSVLVAASLASLNMSPNEVSDGNTGTAASPTFSAECSPTGNDNTWEGVVDLGSVNVSGGAMDVPGQTPVPPLPCNNSITPMPHCQSTSTMGAHLTPPPANGTMGAIHSLGGALDEATISPTFMSSMSQNLKSPSLYRRPPTPAAVKAIETAPIGSSDPFLGSPRLDQTIEFTEVLRELSFTSPPPEFSSPVARLLSKVDPSMDWILQCLDDLMYRATTPTSNQVVAFTAVEAEQKVIGGWKSLEVEFLEGLLHRLKIAELELIESCHNLDEALPLPVQAATCEFLEREIGRLKLELTMERHEMDLQEASFGRQYALLCQATERLCLHGFYVEQFDDENKELCFENHTFHGEATVSVMLNLESTENILKLKPTVSDCEKFMRSSSQIAILNDLFSSFLNMLMGDSSPLLHGLLQCRDMQDCYLKIARWLDFLVRLARDLDAMQGKISVSINLPYCTVTILPSQNTTIYFTMDPVTDSISSKVSMAMSGSFEVVSACHGLSDWSFFSFV